MSKYTSWHKYFDDTRLIYTYNLKLLFLTHLAQIANVEFF